MFLSLPSLFQYRCDTFNWIVKAVNLQLFYYQIPATLVLIWMIQKGERDWAREIERDMRRERKEQTLTAAQTEPPFKISEQLQHLGNQTDKTPAKISNSISNKQQPQTNTFSASHGLLTNHCQTALGHLRRWGGGGRNSPNKLEMSNGTPVDLAPCLHQKPNKETEMSWSTEFALICLMCCLSRKWHSIQVWWGHREGRNLNECVTRHCIIILLPWKYTRGWQPGGGLQKSVYTIKAQNYHRKITYFKVCETMK